MQELAESRPYESATLPKIFVSYSREDKPWRKRFQKTIGSGTFEGKFQLWFDDSIGVGANWKDEIDKALAGSRIAVLLVSVGFMVSKFIANDELREILKRHHNNTVRIFWLAIDEVPENVLRAAGLDLIQAGWPLDKKPLSKLKPGELKKALVEIGSRLLDEVEKLERWDDLKQRVADSLSNVKVSLKNGFDEGDYSIFYKGWQADVEVVIKALVPAPGRAWLAEDFLSRAEVVRKIENSTAIKIRHVVGKSPALVGKPTVPCVVMDFVPAPTLESRLDLEQKLSPQSVAKIIAQCQDGQAAWPTQRRNGEYSQLRAQSACAHAAAANQKTSGAWRESRTFRCVSRGLS
jgi:TIR domain